MKHVREVFGLVVLGSLVLTTGVYASESSSPTRLGAFAGAMRVCESHHDGNERRFRWARLRAADDISNMDRSEKLQALAARDRAIQRRKFFGEPLNSASCLRLLRLTEWQRFHN